MQTYYKRKIKGYEKHCFISCPLRRQKTSQTEQREKLIESPPLSPGSTSMTYFFCLFCDKCLHLHTNTKTSRHGISLWHFIHSVKNLFCSSHWTAPCQSVWNWGGRNTEKRWKKRVHSKLYGVDFISVHLTSVFQHCLIINIISLCERLRTKC